MQIETSQRNSKEPLSRTTHMLKEEQNKKSPKSKPNSYAVDGGQGRMKLLIPIKKKFPCLFFRKILDAWVGIHSCILGGVGNPFGEAKKMPPSITQSPKIIHSFQEHTHTKPTLGTNPRMSRGCPLTWWCTSFGIPSEFLRCTTQKFCSSAFAYRAEHSSIQFLCFEGAQPVATNSLTKRRWSLKPPGPSVPPGLRS